MVGGPNATGLVKNDAVSTVTEDIVVCRTCGSGSNPQAIGKCARCNDYEHGYCMKVLTFEIPPEWHCAKCQEHGNGSPKPSQGGKTQLQKPRPCDVMNERETSKMHLSHSNVVPQISPTSPYRFAEEAALSSRERPPLVRSRSAEPQPCKASSSSTTIHLSNLNCASPSRSDTQVQALKRCAGASHSQTKIEDRPYFAMQQSQVHPASQSRFAEPQPSMASSSSTTIHLSNLNYSSPSRSDTQVQALKRCAGASHSQTKIEDKPYFATQLSQVHPASPPSMKQPSDMKSIYPRRSDVQVQNLKRCVAARHGQAKADDNPYFAMRQSQAHPASPPHVKRELISSNRTVTQVHGTKRTVAACHDQAKVDDIDMDCETRSGGSMPIIHKCRTSEPVEEKSVIEHKAREKKIVNADKAGTSSLTEDGDTEYKSEMGSLNENKGVILTMGSIVEYSRLPAPAICWRGCFHVVYAGAKLNLGEFKAQFPLKVSSRVFDTIKKIPSDLQLELLPRMNDWPKYFETFPPVYEDIGVFFFFDKSVGCEKKHSNLLEDSNNYVLRAYVDGIKLLIYSSEVLPPDSQWINGENYLWGLFVRSKGKSDPWQFGSTTTG